MSLSDEEIFSGLATFPGVPGRLQGMGDHDGVKIYNDNNATTPQATLAGLRALGTPEQKNIILIVGGAFKNIDPTPLVNEIPQYCKHVILLPGTGSDLIKNDLDAMPVDTVEEAVDAAFAAAQPGDTILFSPGFASFGLFKNEYERNDAFVASVVNRDEKSVNPALLNETVSWYNRQFTH